MFVVNGWLSDRADSALGLIYVPAWIAISIASVSLAPFGAKLAHRLPVKLLRRVFAAFLIIVAINLLMKQE